MSADGCSDPSVVEWEKEKLMMMTACDDGRRRVYESGDKGESWTEALGTLSRVWSNKKDKDVKLVRSGFITATLDGVGKKRKVMLVTRSPLGPFPEVSAANPCRPADGGFKSSCPICCRVRSSVHNTTACARRARPGVPILGESLTCGCRNGSTVFLTAASRAGRHRKGQEYEHARHAVSKNACVKGEPGASATASQMPLAAESSTDHGRLRFIRCWNAPVVWNCDCDCLGLPQPARWPVCDGRPASLLLMAFWLLTDDCNSIKENKYFLIAMNIDCAFRGPTIHVVCGDFSCFIVTFLLCCCVRRTSSCVCAYPP
ncbi:trans-sialidase, putative [Trypanosoma cruzi marinkellei]|uniref:Trans-sialidase, putative n=1 Tax=Trypanosoma cruzi marinkellei TaxID=85056 RepID=K2M315_TRYCR|nr:trans-sialidase, putative [Trypanosoma cruzi marinkellei]